MPFYVAAKRHSVVHWDKCRLHSCKISQNNLAMTIYIHTSYYSKFVLKTNPTRLNFLYIFLIKDKGVDELQIQNSLNRHSALATITF